MRYKIGICGALAYGNAIKGGQVIKTRIIAEEFQRILDPKEMITVDTANWKRNAFSLLCQCFIAAKTSRNIVLLPARNGIKILIPLFVLLRFFFKYKLHYVTIGGWLAERAAHHWIVYFLKKVDVIYVETNFLQQELIQMRFNNIVYMPNFKRLHILSEAQLHYDYKKPYKICTFSRVAKEKGIENIIEATKKVNQKLGKVGYELDIYGPIENEYKVEFHKIMQAVPAYIQYKGVVPFDQTVEVLKNYFMLAFPTYYPGEGFPGTLIDAFSAGLPVIATDWRYNSEIVKGHVGIIYRGDTYDPLIRAMLEIHENPQIILSMKKECLKEAEKYIPDKVMKILVENLRC